MPWIPFNVENRFKYIYHTILGAWPDHEFTSLFSNKILIHLFFIFRFLFQINYLIRHEHMDTTIGHTRFTFDSHSSITPHPIYTNPPGDDYDDGIHLIDMSHFCWLQWMAIGCFQFQCFSKRPIRISLKSNLWFEWCDDCR